MRNRLIVHIGVIILLSLTGVGVPAAARDAEAPALLHLRRATFNPLDKALSAPAVTAAAPSELLLVQLSGPPDEHARERLAAAGLTPLWYVPDNAFLVRATAGAAGKSLASIAPEVRWIGAYTPWFKLAPELDGQLASGADLDLQLVVAPDAAPDGVAREVVARGGRVLELARGVNGTVLRVTLPSTALSALLARDDLLWAEPYLAAEVLVDRARAIGGVPGVHEELGLTGEGQIIAVTDTGLDVEHSLSADFSGRVARGFSRQEMFAPCQGLAALGEPNTWSDLHGHGTHVAGLAVGSGALSDGVFSGVAPGARLVVQAVSSGGTTLDCLPSAQVYLGMAYEAGARIHNGSFGRRTGSGSCEYGCYTAEDSTIDDFLWKHKDYLFVVAAGNQGVDDSRDGVVDADSLNSPGTAKNVVTVGASENQRAGLGSCGAEEAPEFVCYGTAWGSNFPAEPIRSDFISDNPNGMAAFSSRGPTDDGRIKPDLVAPGTNIISARSHKPGALYGTAYSDDYAYLSGTSMATPQVSGVAALARQWLARDRLVSAPSAALLKALLLNGAVSLRPGQYATVAELPDAWPNSVEGWGRLSAENTVGLGGEDRIWLAEHGGVATGQLVEYALSVQAGEPLRVTLAWTDYPGAPGVSKALVNDLDLRVIAPGGVVLAGNSTADLSLGCRFDGADRCNNVESVELPAPHSGIYIVQVYGASVPFGPQPFALAARGEQILDPALSAPLLEPIAGPGPALALKWSAVDGAAFYRVQISSSSSFADVTTEYASQASHTAFAQEGSYFVRVRACTVSACGPYSNVRSITVTRSPLQFYVPLVQS